MDIWERTGIVATKIEIVSVNLVDESSVLRLICDSRFDQRLSAIDLRAASAADGHRHPASHDDAAMAGPARQRPAGGDRSRRA